MKNRSFVSHALSVLSIVLLSNCTSPEGNTEVVDEKRDSSLFDASPDGANPDAANPDAANPDATNLDGGIRDASADAARDGQAQDANPQDGGALVAQANAEMNDLSILWPIGASTAQLPFYLQASSAGTRGVLYPESLHAQVLDSNISTCRGEGPPRVFPECIVYNQLRILALRVDPCFADLNPDPHGGTCRNQLRLVAQVVRPSSLGDTSGPGDAALHFFYDLTREELKNLAIELVNLRVANTASNERLGALDRHPILVRQGLAGSFAAGLREIVLRYAGATNISRVAILSIPDPNADFVWVFNGFEVARTQSGAFVATPMNIPTASNPDVQSFDLNSEPRISGQSTHEDEIESLLSVQGLQQSTLAERLRALNSTFRLENPGIHSPDTIDCVSCHLAQPGREFAFDNGFIESSVQTQANANAFVRDAEYVTEMEARAQPVPMDIDGSDQTESRLPNVHAFSYRRAVPHINQRTVNETAAAVSYINRYVFRNP